MYDDGPLSTRQQLDALKLERERAKLLADQAKAQQQVNKLDAPVPPVQQVAPPLSRGLTAADTAIDTSNSPVINSADITKLNEGVQSTPVSGPSISIPTKEIPRLSTEQSTYDALKQLNLPLPNQASTEELIPDPLAVNNGQTVDQALSQLRLKAHDGGPAIINPDGTTSTEVSITVTDPSLNNGAPTNIPSLWNGKIVDQDTAIANALKAGADKYKSYNSVEEAVAAAKERSDNGGAYAASAVPPPVNNPAPPPVTNRGLSAEVLDSQATKSVNDPGLFAEVEGSQINVDSKEVSARITSDVTNLSPEDQARFSLLGRASRANVPLIKSLQESLKDINKPVQVKEDLPTTFWEGLSKGFGEMFTSAEFVRFGLLLAGGLISGGSIGGSLKYAGLYAMQSAEKRLASEKAAKAKAQQAEQARKEKLYDATTSQIRTLEGEDRTEVRAVEAENRALIRKFGEEQRALQRELNKEDRGFNEYLRKKELELKLTLNAERRSQLREEYTNLRERDESLSTLLTNALASTNIDPKIREQAYNQFVKNSSQPDVALRVRMQDDLAKRLNLETREKEPNLTSEIRMISGVPQEVRVDANGNVFREVRQRDGSLTLTKVPYAMTQEDYAKLTSVGKKAITDAITPLIAGNNVKVNPTQIAGALAEKTISVVQAMEVFNSNVQPRDLSNMSASAMRAIGPYDPSKEDEAQYIDRYHSALYTSSVVALKPSYTRYFTDKKGEAMSSAANNLIRQKLAGGNLDQKVEKLVKDYDEWVKKPNTNNRERLTAAMAREEGESPLSAYLKLIR